ncbi:MAG: hypothetical protein WA081_11115 [Desulfosalsimonadaceae bacterium]
MVNENPENIPSENEPESITPEIVDENDAGMMETVEDEFFPEEDEPPVDDPADDENSSDPNLPDSNLPDLNLIDEAVAFIRTTIAAMIENAALKIGDYLLTRFFDGDIELAISHNRYKNISFTHLCRRPDIPLTRREMGLMVRMAFQEKELIEMGVDTSMLLISHKRYLTQVPNGQAKYDLVMECIREKWPAWKLAARIRQMQLAVLVQLNPAYPNEKIVSGYKKTMTRLVDRTPLPELLATQEGLYRLDRQTVLDLKQTALQWMAGLEAKRRECAALIEQLDYTVEHPNY